MDTPALAPTTVGVKGRLSVDFKEMPALRADTWCGMDSYVAADC